MKGAMVCTLRITAAHHHAYLGWDEAESMASHFNILTWRISWTEEPGRFQCMELHRVRHD